MRTNIIKDQSVIRQHFSQHPSSASVFHAAFTLSAPSAPKRANSTAEGKPPPAGMWIPNSWPSWVKWTFISPVWSNFWSMAYKSFEAALRNLNALRAWIIADASAEKSMEVGIVLSTKNDWSRSPSNLLLAAGSSNSGTASCGQRFLWAFTQDFMLDSFQFP